MKVAIGSDHHGLEHRKTIAGVVTRLSFTPVDMGSHGSEPCDYPEIAFAVAEAVRDGSAERGVLVCGTGIGMAIAANKVSGVRAAVCHNIETTQLSRQHNNANVLCVPGKSLTAEQLDEIVQVWLTTEFDGGRHERRVSKIMNYQQQQVS